MHWPYPFKLSWCLVTDLINSKAFDLDIADSLSQQLRESASKINRSTRDGIRSTWRDEEQLIPPTQRCTCAVVGRRLSANAGPPYIRRVEIRRILLSNSGANDLLDLRNCVRNFTMEDRSSSDRTTNRAIMWKQSWA